MDAVLIKIEESIATLTLNRPEKFNALNRELALTLQKKLKEAEANESVRCIVITGAGRAFSAGQDLTEIKDPTGPEMKRILPEQLNPIISILRSIQKPVIAAVNGIAAGASANIALSCDLVVAAESAYFTQAFSKIGLIPDSGGTYLLPRLIGLQRATALMMTGDPVSAADAEKMGMIFKSFPDERFFYEVEMLAKKIAGMPTKALIYTRLALEESMNSNFEQQLAHEAKWQEEASHTEDFAEGVRAFLEKRKPVFKGK